MFAPTRRQVLAHLGWWSVIPGWPRLSSAESQPPRTIAGLSDYQWVNRITWGANDTELARVAQLGQQEWLRQQLDGTASTDLPPGVQNRIDALTIQQQTLMQIAESLWKQRQTSDVQGQDGDAQKTVRAALNDEMNRLAREAATRHLLRALYSPAQLRERLTWFWFNHFNVFARKHQIRAMVGDYEERAIRPHVLGHFRELLGAVLHHPAMLVYLDNNQNAVGKLNENLARELMELHTLGVDAGYTQQDVQEVAKVLTGHGLRSPNEQAKPHRKLAKLYQEDGLYAFHPARHDFSDKRVLGRTIQGRGAAELDEVLDMLAAHPATARFISLKLAKAFTSDHPSEGLIERMTQAFKDSDGHIARTLEAMFNHPDFKQAESRHFKDPVHYVVSAVRATYGDRIILNTEPMEHWIQRLGEGLYQRQTPDGYSLMSDAWSSSGQLTARFDTARVIGSGAARLFKLEDMEGAASAPVPHIADSACFKQAQALLGPDTIQALSQATKPQVWNTLYLSSPEFMYT